MTKCVHVLFTETNSRINIQCNTGVINLDSIDAKSGNTLFQTGIINKAQELPTYCSNDAFNDPYNCSSYLD